MADGFNQVQVVSFPAASDLKEHTHDELTVHFILEGELVITTNDIKETFKSGDYVEFPAGTTHSASFGPEGCKFVVGFKHNAPV